MIASLIIYNVTYQFIYFLSRNDTAYLLIAFISGILTALAPCILPVLPVIVGGSIGGERRRNPFIITASLAVSLVLFTLLLKVSAVFINVPQSAWSIISGAIIIFLGLISIFPAIWEQISARFHLGSSSEQLLSESAKKKTWAGDALIGASLGPVFSACSPVYFFILASILPVSFSRGVVYLSAYALGLAAILLAIALVGQKLVQKIRFAADPRGWFKRAVGVLFVLVGLSIITGNDKKLQTYILDKGFFDISKVEIKLLEKAGP